jgi:HEAT repeat protein
MGPKASAAVPALIKLVNDPNAEVRFSAVLALRYMGTEVVQAIPALSSALNDNAIGLRRPGNDFQVREMAAQVLGRIGPDARMAVPGLRRMLSDTNAPTRQEAMLALWRIDHDTNLVSQAVAEVEHAPDALTCKRFVGVLGAMRSAAMPAVPAVLRAITNSARLPNLSTTDVPRAVRIALRKIDPAGAAKFDGQVK